MKIVLSLMLSLLASVAYSQSIFLTGSDYCSGELEITEKNDHLNVQCKGELILANDYDLSDKKSLAISANSIFLSGSVTASMIDLNLQAPVVKWGVKNHFNDSQIDLGFPIDKNNAKSSSLNLVSNSIITSLGHVDFLVSPAIGTIGEASISTGGNVDINNLGFVKLELIKLDEPLLLMPSAVVVSNTLTSHVIYIDVAEVPLPAGFLLFFSAMSGLFLFKNKA